MPQINDDMYKGLILLGYTGALPTMYRDWKKDIGLSTMREEYEYYEAQGNPYGYHGMREYWQNPVIAPLVNIFNNSGFDTNLTPWQQLATAWVFDVGTARLTANAQGQLLFQNPALSTARRYRIDCDLLEGGVDMNYLVFDTNSGVPVGTPHEFNGSEAANVSYGIISAANATGVVDNLTLFDIGPAI